MPYKKAPVAEVPRSGLFMNVTIVLCNVFKIFMSFLKEKKTFLKKMYFLSLPRFGDNQ